MSSFFLRDGKTPAFFLMCLFFMDKMTDSLLRRCI